MTMSFTPEQLQEHDALVRKTLKTEIVGMLESYAEGCREQALAQGITHQTEHLRGAMETCQFMSAVIRMID